MIIRHVFVAEAKRAICLIKKKVWHLKNKFRTRQRLFITPRENISGDIMTVQKETFTVTKNRWERPKRHPISIQNIFIRTAALVRFKIMTPDRFLSVCLDYSSEVRKWFFRLFHYACLLNRYFRINLLSCYWWLRTKLIANWVIPVETINALFVFVLLEIRQSLEIVGAF